MQLQAYFQAYRNYFWQWEDSTEILAIPNGSTIAYKAFVLEVIEQIAPTGTPPFGALLFMLIATNPTAESDLEQIKERFRQQLETKENQTGYHNQAFEFLAKVQALPKAYKTGTKRVLLLQTIFKDSHNHLSTKKSKQVLREYQQNKDQFPQLILSQEKEFSSETLYKDFRGFRYMNEKFPTSKSILEALANLPDLEETAVEKIIEQTTEPIETAILLEELMENSETFLVAALVKHLWSGLNIPFQKLSPNEQPLGGISDITNKGNFDRLLISEFAYDELSFMSRLANNEALYLHREAPPAANHLERIVLIDVSLKNWGTPRTIAYAILLALAYHPKAKTACKAYAIGGRLISKSIQFNSLDSIINSLQFLDTSLDCAKGLKPFLEQGIVSKQTEIIYIGVEEATKSTAFRQAIHPYQQHFQYWVHPNSEGQIKVYKNKGRAKKHVQTIQLPLEKLWKNQNKLHPERLEKEDIHNCPILLPQPTQSKCVLSTTDEAVFIITTGKDLLYSGADKDSHRKKGWDLMYHNLPVTSGLFEIGLTSDGSYILLAFDLQTKMLSLINCQTKEVKQEHFKEWVSSPQREFLFQEDVFYYSAKNKCWSFSFYTTEIIAEVDCPPDFSDWYKYRAKELETLNKKLGYAPSILKNIHTLELSIKGNLLFNGKHELLLNPYGFIKLELTNSLRDQHRAVNTVNKRVFVFKDGSEVRISSFGLILLISSDPTLPTIYVPMLIDAALGLGTEDSFAGKDYYYPTSNTGGLAVMKTEKFWATFIHPFIETIKA